MTHKLGGPNHVNNLGGILSGILALGAQAQASASSAVAGVAGGSGQQQQDGQDHHGQVKTRPLDYARAAFDVGQQDHDRIMSEAVEEKVLINNIWRN